MTDGAIYFAEQGGDCVLRFEGAIRYTLAPSLDRFLDRLFARGGFERILLDLTTAESIDSTGLGLLAKVAVMEQKRSGARPLLFSSQPDINELLGSLCLDKVFVISDPTPSHVKGEALPEMEPSPPELASVILDAHRRLAAMNDNNRAMFRNVVDELSKELGQS